MKSARRGRRTSAVEVTNLSQHGFWILIRERELFVPFDQFPWFEAAPIAHVLNVQMPTPGHLHWPDLDVDLAVESIEKPDDFPLVSRKLPKAPLRVKRPTDRRISRVSRASPRRR